MEERSPKRPRSSDWKPYEREQEPEQPQAESKSDSTSDWKPYEREKEPEPAQAESKSESAGDWKRYDRDERREAQPSGDDRGEQPAAERASDQTRDEERSESRPEKERRPDGDRESDGDRRSNGDRQTGEKHEPSTVDAMGQEKHRKVIGERYGASRTRQFLYYGAFVAFVIAAYIGLKAATDKLDKAPAKDADQAPWSKPDATGEPLGGFEPESQENKKGATDFQ